MVQKIVMLKENLQEEMLDNLIEGYTELDKQIKELTKQKNKIRKEIDDRLKVLDDMEFMNEKWYFKLYKSIRNDIDRDEIKNYFIRNDIDIEDFKKESISYRLSYKRID